MHKPAYKASPYFSNEKVIKRKYFLTKVNMSFSSDGYKQMESKKKVKLSL
jgi:hypothetical protein